MGPESDSLREGVDAQQSSGADSIGSTSKRFEVALSFPGENREFVLAVADALAEKLPRECIFYDEWYEVELAGTDGDIKLRSMYDNAMLLVPFFSQHYSKPWCRMEWGVIRGVLLNRRDEDAVFPIHLDDTNIPGWTSVDFGIFLRGRGPRQIAALILEKLASKCSTLSHLKSKSADPSSWAVNTSSPTIYFSPQWPTTDPEVFGREKELALLDQAWDEGKLNIVSLVAAGGVGKTALVNRWAIYHMTPDAWRGAERVFAWSFYNQGSTEGRYSSSDIFLAKALRRFGDEECAASALDPYNKGQRLAELVREKRTLLLLDGAEPLQEPPGAARPGQIQDMGLKGLLKGLAFTNPGLCVISTHWKVADLKPYSAVGGTVLSVDISDLAPESGMAYLKSMGVRGRDDELLQASKDFGHNALALTLLGHCLSTYHRGDVRRRMQVRNLFRSSEKGRHARRVMAWYAKTFGDKSEGELLSILGLFDRPAESRAVEAVRSGKKLKGLTERLSKLSSEDWLDVLESLREARLLSQDDSASDLASRPPGYRSSTTKDTLLDCHPLVREYFGMRLKQKYSKAWKEAHDRLYEYYRELPNRDLPDTLEEMSPLFHAIYHGCCAGRYTEVLQEIYDKRINRQNLNENGGPVRNAHGAMLRALSNFFLSPWHKPTDKISLLEQSFVMNEAAHHLRALGLLLEAMRAMKAGLSMLEKIESREGYLTNTPGQGNRQEVQNVLAYWCNVSRLAANISELLLALGEVSEAIQYARRAVECSAFIFGPPLRNKSCVISIGQLGGRFDAFQMVVSKAKVGDALHNFGQIAEAETEFGTAEKLWKSEHPDEPILSGYRGFLYCDLLLTKGAVDQVIVRSRQVLEWYESDFPERALDCLNLGRAALLTRFELASAGLGDASEHLTASVDGLRRMGVQEFVARGLLARAELHRVLDGLDNARQDLEEAWEIATSGRMRLIECDVYLECARELMALVKAGESLTLDAVPPDSPFRLFLNTPEAEDPGNGHSPELRAARAHLAEVGRLITETGYHRRDPELLLETARLEFLEGQINAAHATLARAKARVDEMGAHGLDFDVRALEKLIG